MGNRARSLGENRQRRQCRPAKRSGKPGNQHQPRVKPQCPERDQHKEIKKRRHFQREGGFLLILHVIGPGEQHEQRDVGENRHRQQQRRHPPAERVKKPPERQHHVPEENERHRLHHCAHAVGWPRCQQVERAKDAAERELGD